MAKKPRALISACLLGVRCRYDARGSVVGIPERLAREYALIPVCPEQLGGLPTPRTPSERFGARVLTRDHCDVTEAFHLGAKQTVRLARLFGVRAALLKSRSPSCGFGTIYDGSFRGRLVPGNGVAAEALAACGIRVFTEENAEEFIQWMEANSDDVQE